MMKTHEKAIKIEETKNNKMHYEKMKFCIISSCKNQYYKNNLLLFALEHKM